MVGKGNDLAYIMGSSGDNQQNQPVKMTLGHGNKDLRGKSRGFHGANSEKGLCAEGNCGRKKNKKEENLKQTQQTGRIREKEEAWGATKFGERAWGRSRQ